MIKIFGIGNIMLSDDGIGVKVCKCIRERFSAYDKIEFILGETDVLYCLECLENISDEDLIIIIDSTYFGVESGSVLLYEFNECDRFINESMDSHGETLLKILRREYRKINGYLIGVEVAYVECSLEISKELKDKFDIICNEVEKKIKNIYLISGGFNKNA